MKQTENKRLKYTISCKLTNRKHDQKYIPKKPLLFNNADLNFVTERISAFPSKVMSKQKPCQLRHVISTNFAMINMKTKLYTVLTIYEQNRFAQNLH